MSDSKRNSVVQTVLTVLLVGIIGANIWWFVTQKSSKRGSDLVDEAAPTFSLDTFDPKSQDFRGAPLSLADLHGKVVLLDFWATHCGPCKRQMPILEKIYKDLPDDRFVVVSINLDKEPDPERKTLMADFLGSREYTFPMVLDDGSVQANYGVKRIPMMFLIDADGEVQFAHSGLMSEKKLRDRIDSHL